MVMAVMGFGQVGRVVYEEDAVEVVGLMLEYLREDAAPAPLEPIPVRILGPHGRALVAARLAVDMAYRQAALIHLEPAARGAHELRIDIHAYLGRGSGMLSGEGGTVRS